MTFLRIVIQLYLLFEYDLRANAFRVCREGKPVPTFPDHALARSDDDDLGADIDAAVEIDDVLIAHPDAA